MYLLTDDLLPFLRSTGGLQLIAHSSGDWKYLPVVQSKIEFVPELNFALKTFEEDEGESQGLYSNMKGVSFFWANVLNSSIELMAMCTNFQISTPLNSKQQ